jgi:hypothetical protein
MLVGCSGDHRLLFHMLFCFSSSCLNCFFILERAWLFLTAERSTAQRVVHCCSIASYFLQGWAEGS